jgi:hypothetical protein
MRTTITRHSSALASEAAKGCRFFFELGEDKHDRVWQNKKPDVLNIGPDGKIKFAAEQSLQHDDAVRQMQAT